MHKIGVIHGRFQMLHLAHMEYLLAGKARCDFLYVGITNPDPNLTKDAIEDTNRSQDHANPFTYFERLEMLRDALIEFGIPRNQFEIVPFPITHAHLIKFYTPTEATYFVTIYDEWGRAKATTLQGLGLPVEIMWERPLSQKAISGSQVRKLIAEGKQWENLVPTSVAEYVLEHRLVDRITKLYSHDSSR